MLSEEDNEYLTRVGSDTPMGKFLRQFWVPVLYSHEIPDNDGAPVRIRLMGENLVAFRNSSGQVGLLDHHCPHRRASLFFGRNEEDGLRCLYHGWKFDIDGNCLDMPNEEENCPLKAQVKAKAYHCREDQGIIWVFMGVGELPPLPEIGWARVPISHKGTLKYMRECNWAQAMEGDFDSSHLSFLHRAFDENIQDTKHDKKSGTDYYRNIARMGQRPKLDVVDTDNGVVYGAMRSTEEEHSYWRVTRFHLPFYTSVPAYLGLNRLKIWVPMDDHHTMVWEANWNMNSPLSEKQRKGWKDRVGNSGFKPDTDDWFGRGRFAANRENDYLIDRERQKNFNFSGMENVTPVQDGAMQESMGAIVDRSKENLVSSDAALLRMRRCLIRCARQFEVSGELPMGVKHSENYHGHGEQMLIEQGDHWYSEYQRLMLEIYSNSPLFTNQYK